MSKKDYELIALVFHHCRLAGCDRKTLDAVSAALAERFARNNQKFNHAKFMSVCKGDLS